MQLFLFFIFLLAPKIGAPFASLFVRLELHQEIILGRHFVDELIETGEVLQAHLLLDDLLLMGTLLST